MTSAYLSGNFAFPAVALLLAIGIGLLVRELAGEHHDDLLFPVGFAGLMVVANLATARSDWSRACGWIVLAFALAGFALAARTRRLPRIRIELWSGLGALGAFLLVSAPSLFSGRPEIAGYTRNVDTGLHIDFAQYLVDAGRVIPTTDSSYHASVVKFINDGYPGGTHSVLAAVSTLIHVNLVWSYQPFMGMLAAAGGGAVAALLGRFGVPGPLRALGGILALGAAPLYGYALGGGIKELGGAVTVLICVAVLTASPPSIARVRSGITLAVAVAAAIAAFSLGVAPWLAFVLGGTFILSMLRPGRLATLRTWVLAGVGAAVLSLPSLITAAALFNIAKGAVGGVINLGLGALARPVSAWSSTGVWLTPDFRFPPTHLRTSEVIGSLAILAGAVGLVGAVRRRAWPVAWLAVSAPISVWYWHAHTGPWITFKAYTITAALSITLAFVGIGVLWPRRRPTRRTLVPSAAALALLGLIAAGVIYGDAVTYHDTSLTPAGELVELASVDDHFAGQGPTLFPQVNEFSEYLLRRMDADSPLTPGQLGFGYRPGVPSAGNGGFQFTINQLMLPFIERFRTLVLPRNPLSNRPPVNYKLISQLKYVEVWQRRAPSHLVIDHLPLSDLPSERTPAYCRAFTKIVAADRRAGGRFLAIAQLPAGTSILPGALNPPRYWPQAGAANIRAKGAGRLSGTVRLPVSGPYEVWMQGSLGRPVTVSLDGHHVGTVGYEENYPGAWIDFGHVSVPAGSASVVLSRGNGTLYPGSGDSPDDNYSGQFGNVVVQSTATPLHRVSVVPISQASQVCAAPVGYEWVEVLRSAPGQAL